MRGRKPKPTSLHRLHGTFQKVRHEHREAHEPVAVGDLLSEPPDWMSDDQQNSWRYAIEHAPMGLLKKIDRGVLGVWVIAESQHRIAAMKQAQIDEGNTLPLLLKKGNGKANEFYVSPYLGIMNRAAARMLKAGSELGFSPASRPRLAMGAPVIDGDAEEDDESPWSKLRLVSGGREAS